MPKLLNFASKESFTIRASKDEKSAEIIIYSPIGNSFWEETVSAKTFDKQLRDLPKSIETLNVRINSPGGDVFDGFAIYNRLKQHKAKVIVYVDGIAASIASVIALAGDEIIMGESSFFMIHLPWTIAAGNRMDLENVQNRLIDIEDQLVALYANKTGLDKNKIRSMMEEETWFNADEALDNGFATSKMEDSMPIAASIFDSKWIKRAPKNFKSETQAASNAIETLKKKIEAKVARK